MWVEPGSWISSSRFRIPLKKFRSIRRELTDSGRTAEELLAGKHSTKYNFGFPSSNAPTPETLKNYLDVSIPLQTSDLWAPHSLYCTLQKLSSGRATTKVLLCCGRLCLSLEILQAKWKIRLACQASQIFFRLTDSLWCWLISAITCESCRRGTFTTWLLTHCRHLIFKPLEPRQLTEFVCLRSILTNHLFFDDDISQPLWILRKSESAKHFNGSGSDMNTLGKVTSLVSRRREN